MAPVLSRAAIDACVFDAYGTLFDVGASARRCADSLGDAAVPVAELWRTKQLEYSWLRSLMGDYADFWQVTAHALDHALETHGIDDPVLRSRLMELYLSLEAYPEAREVLTKLKAAGLRTAVLSNGSSTMVTSAVGSSGLRDLLDDLLTVDPLRTYKPHPSVYAMALEHLGTEPERVCFLSSNSWDVHGASTFGFITVWVNRNGLKPDRLPGGPAHEIPSLGPLPALFGL